MSKKSPNEPTWSGFTRIESFDYFKYGAQAKVLRRGHKAKRKVAKLAHSLQRLDPESTFQEKPLLYSLRIGRALKDGISGRWRKVNLPFA